MEYFRAIIFGEEGHTKSRCIQFKNRIFEFRISLSSFKPLIRFRWKLRIFFHFVFSFPLSKLLWQNVSVRNSNGHSKNLLYLCSQSQWIGLLFEFISAIQSSVKKGLSPFFYFSLSTNSIIEFVPQRNLPKEKKNAYPFFLEN